jgi:hypothetical protein
MCSIGPEFGDLNVKIVPETECVCNPVPKVKNHVTSCISLTGSNRTNIHSKF